MHTIDLLKGQGIPAKTTLGSMFFVSVIATVPIIVAAIMMSMYLLNNIKIDMEESSIAKSKEQIADSEPNLLKTRDLEQERDILAERLREVSRCVDTFVQFSPMLIALSEEMPGEITMDRLEATSTTGKAATGRKDNDPNKPAVIPMPKRAVAFDIRGNERGGYGNIVQNYQDSLQLSAAFEQKFEAQPYRMETGTGDDRIETYFLRFESLTQ